MASPLDDPFAHSIDNDAFHFPGGPDNHWDVYQYTKELFGGSFGLTKYMVLELVVAVICIILFVPLAWSICRKGYARGRIANLFESFLFFIRDGVAVPAIGAHHANHFMPFLWTVFFFILGNNLLGMIPWMGSATAALGCTGALALCSFFVIHGGGAKELGVGAYAKSIVPPVHWMLYPLMLVIELLGHMIKPSVLAFRLFVNILAGHTVLYCILGFIAMVGPGILFFVVTPASVFGVLALSLLELFVAFLQAFVFTFLSAIFIGAAVHPHH